MIQKFQEFISINEATKPKEVYSIKIERSGTFGNSYRTRYQQGTLEELIKAFSYDLEVGESWQHEKGNKKINRKPKNIKSLCDNLYHAKNNAAANGYGGYSYEVIDNKDNPEFKTN